MLFTAKVLYDYTPATHDELPLSIGNKVDVLSTEDDPWWLCSDRSGREGMVPSNYLSRLPLLEPKAPSKGTDQPQRKIRPGQQQQLHGQDQKQIVESVQNLHLLRKQADARIEVLKTVVEKLERTSTASSRSLSPRAGDVLRRSIGLSDGGDDVERASKYSNSPVEGSSPNYAAINSARAVALKEGVQTTVSSISSASSKSPSQIALPHIAISKASPTTHNHIRSSVAQSPRIIQTQTQSQSPPPRITNQDAGFRYSPCRSVIYYPSTQDVNTYSQEPPEASLKLNFVHSYEGDTSKFGGSIKGKNIMWLLDGRMAFPAASLVVVLDIPLNKQSYFTGHSGDVTALTIHAERGVAASAEQGKMCRILIWDISILESNDSSSEYAAEIELSTALAVRMVFGISFSCDCKYLVALCAAEKNLIYIFALESQEVLATMRLGHNEVFQMGFNPFLFTPTRAAYDDHVMQNSAGKTPERSSCYTLVSCGGKQVKFWTFGEVIEQVDNLQDITGFKGRKLATPKNKQQWQRRYILEGTTAHASTSGDAPDITCFCPIYDGKVGSFVKSRIFTGTSSGAVYIWEQLEEKNSLGGAFWQPRGKLLSIVTSVHDNHIVDLDYSGPASYATDENEAEDEEEIDHDWVERIVSTGLDGVVNTWRINRSAKQSTKKTPFSHETCISVASLDNGIGQPRCVSFNLDCDAVVLGTTGNSICMLNGMAAEPGKSIDEGRIELRHLISGHQGKVRMLAMHPSRDVFATVSSDKSLRLWDSEQRRQIAITRGLGSPSAVTFSPEGSQVAVGNEAGELVVLTQAKINRNFEVPLSARVGNDGWCVLVRRSLAPKGKSPIKKAQKKVGGGTNFFVQNYEVTCLAYSPNGEFIAVACRDKYIHILSVANAFKRVAVCKGHSSYVTCIDFSADGQYLQSNDTLRELLYFDVTSGRVLNQASIARDVEWSSWTCLYGWPCQGIYNGSTGAIQEGEINSVARSNKGDLLVCGGSNTIDSSVKLFRFPSLPGSIPLVYGGHTSPVLDVSFVASDETVVSAGGNDLCVFQWEVLRPEMR